MRNLKHRRVSTAALSIAALVLACSSDVTGPSSLELTLVSGDGQVGSAGAVLSRPLVVRVTRDGRPVGGIRIDWAAEEQGGSLSAQEIPTLTDGTGHARIDRTLGPAAGTYGTTASVAVRAGASVRFTSVAQIQGGMRMTYAAESGLGQVDSVFARLRPFRVLVTDHRDEPVAGVTVRWWPGGTETTTDAEGIAALAFDLTDAVGTHTMAAQVTGLIGSPVSFTAIARAANPVALVATRDANGVGLAGTLLSPYQVEAIDAYDNAVDGVAVEWSVAAGGGTLHDVRTTTSLDPDIAPTRPFAAVVHRLGSQEGMNAVVATAPGIAGAPTVAFNTTGVSAIVSLVISNDYWCYYYVYCTPTFAPSEVTISPGQSVGWSWAGETCDLVFEDDPQPPVSTTTRTTGSHVRTFDTPGDYRFRCTPYSNSFTSGMVGVVHVR